MEQLVPWLMSEQLPSISSFSCLGRLAEPSGEVTNGLNGVDKVGLELQVMSQIMGVDNLWC